jgi:hypothetical protein
MIFKEQTAVRLRATSELLFIERIDEAAAIAYCQSYGSAGPEGPATVFPLDSLRENAVRAPRDKEALAPSSAVRRLCCRLGMHRWEDKLFLARPILGVMSGRACRYCGDTRLLSSQGRPAKTG